MRRRRVVPRVLLRQIDILDRFLRYALLRGPVKRSFLPPPPRVTPRTFVPYIYSSNDLRRLLGVPDSHYPPASPLTPYTMRTFLLLLYGTGIRMGEAIKMTIEDINLDDAVLTIRDTKFFKSRLVP